jgi:hypothetical protein
MMPKAAHDHRSTLGCHPLGFGVAIGRHAAMVAEVGGTRYSGIPSPNTNVFGVLWLPSIAQWGSLVLPYTLVMAADCKENPVPPP